MEQEMPMVDIEAQANKKTEMEAPAIFKKANRPVTLKVQY